MGLSAPILLPSGRQARFNSNKIFAQYCRAAFPLLPSTASRLSELLHVQINSKDFDWGQLNRVPREFQPTDNPSVDEVLCLRDWLVGTSDGREYFDGVQVALRLQIRGQPTECAVDVPWTFRLPDRVRALPMRRAP